MIDELEELAINYIGEQQYVDLLKKADRDQMEQFLQLYITKAGPNYKEGRSLSSSNRSLEKLGSQSPFNTYHHGIFPYHVKNRNEEKFWSNTQKPRISLIPKSPNLSLQHGSLEKPQPKIKKKRQTDQSQNIHKISLENTSTNQTSGTNERSNSYKERNVSNKFLDLTHHKVVTPKQSENPNSDQANEDLSLS